MKYEAGLEAHFIARTLRFAAGPAMHNFDHSAEVKPCVLSMSIREPVGRDGPDRSLEFTDLPVDPLPGFGAVRVLHRSRQDAPPRRANRPADERNHRVGDEIPKRLSVSSSNRVPKARSCWSRRRK